MQDVRHAILLVDDQEALRQVLRRILEGAGYRVVEAEHGLEALEYVEDSRLRGVLSDIQMPYLDGLGLWHRLQARQPVLPVIFMSGHGSCKEMPDVPYLQKPFQIQELLDLVQKVFV